jgi:hypothetical protein
MCTHTHFTPNLPPRSNCTPPENPPVARASQAAASISLSWYRLLWYTSGYPGKLELYLPAVAATALSGSKVTPAAGTAQLHCSSAKGRHRPLARTAAPPPAAGTLAAASPGTAAAHE